MKQQFEFFWHTQSPFSQWHPSKFEVNGIVFSSAEQYMMYHKALLFRDKNVANKILSLNESYQALVSFISGDLSRNDILSKKELKNEWGAIQKEIKQLGREVKGYNEAVWTRNRERIVSEGNFAKFSQNADLKSILLSKKEKIFVEASPYDKVYGIGLLETDPRAKDPSQWLGLNLLGKILNQVADKMD